MAEKHPRKKPKLKEDETFRLEEEIRDLKALNRSLLKQLKQRSRGIHKEYNLQPDYREDKKKHIDPDCKSCGKGHMKEVDLAGRLFMICSICKHRVKK
jgi:hypothetical protein